MQAKFLIALFMVAVLLGSVMFVSIASADPPPGKGKGHGGGAEVPVACDSCADCTAKLAGRDKIVNLTVDLIDVQIPDGQTACIEFSKSGKTFNGTNHIIDGTGTGYAINLNGYDRITVENVEIKEFDIGIYGDGSDRVTIQDNNLHHNIGAIVWLNGNNFLVENNIIVDNGIGILPDTSTRTLIKDNWIESSDNDAIQAFRLTSSTVTGNILASNNHIGITLDSSSFDNLIFHNNLLYNVIQAHDDGANFWDNGLPDGGNYWSNYDQVEEGCIDENQDGICDAPYSNNGVTDNYPFVNQDGWM